MTDVHIGETVVLFHQYLCLLIVYLIYNLLVLSIDSYLQSQTRLARNNLVGLLYYLSQSFMDIVL